MCVVSGTNQITKPVLVVKLVIVVLKRKAASLLLHVAYGRLVNNQAIVIKLL